MNSFKIVILILFSIFGFIKTQTNTFVDLPYNGNFTFNCNLTNDVTWHLNNFTSNSEILLTNDDKIEVNGSKLFINYINEDILDHCEIFCKNSNETQNFIPLLHLSISTGSKYSIKVSVGANETFQCKVQYGLRNSTVNWEWRMENQSLINAKFAEIKTFGEYNETSELTLRDIKLDTKGNITCTAINKNGEATKFVMLRVDGRLAALWVFLALVVGGIIFSAAFLIFERKYLKNDSEELEFNETMKNLMSKHEDHDDSINNRNDNDLVKRTVNA